MDAAKAAEAVLTSGQSPSTAESGDMNSRLDERPGSSTPSTSSTAIDFSNLNAQTFLVRPTRPDANRNRGRNAFKRRPPPQAQAQAAAQAEIVVDGVVRDTTSSIQARAAAEIAGDTADVVEEENEDLEEFDESLVEEMEHLQLGSEEAWFLSSALGVLRVFDADTVRLLVMSTLPELPTCKERRLTKPSKPIPPYHPYSPSS